MLDCAYMVDEEEEEIQEEEGDCGTHDGQVARRLTGEGKVCPKCFRSNIWKRLCNGKVGSVGPVLVQYMLVLTIEYNDAQYK